MKTKLVISRDQRLAVFAGRNYVFAPHSAPACRACVFNQICGSWPVGVDRSCSRFTRCDRINGCWKEMT